MRRVAVIALAVLVLVATGSAAAVRERTTMSVVLPQLMCVTCHIPLALAQSPQADDERNYVRQLIGAGDTLAQVKASMVAVYGDEVLALPPARGFDLAVYLVPILAVVLLIALLALLLPRWRRNQRAAPASGAGTALSAAEAIRLDEDMRRYD